MSQLRPAQAPRPVHDRLITPGGVAVALDRYQADGRESALVICPGWFQSKDTPTFRRLSETLAATYDVLAMDFRGHGRSGGWYTFSARESEDLETVLRWAEGRYARLGVIGFSLGGSIAINTLARYRPGVRTLVTVGTPASFEAIEFKFWTPDALRTGLRGLEPGAGCRFGYPLLPKERPVENIAGLRGLPILVIHGARDAIVGCRHAERLYAAASPPKRLEIVPDGGHAEALFRERPAWFLELLGGWLRETLPLDAV